MNIELKAPTKDERMGAFRKASWPARLAMHDAIAAAKSEAMEARKELGRRYLEKHPSDIVVPYERAGLALYLPEETRAAREEALRIGFDRAAQHDSGSLQYPALAHDFPADGEAVKIGTAPLFIAPITRYCGMLPVLFNFFYTRAYQNQINANSAHHFHMDPEDTISFKVFIHLTDVDDDSGPFHALPANLTEKVLKAVDYEGVNFLPDEKIDEAVGFSNAMKFTGPKGSVALADTTRCLHFGGRPRAAGQPFRDMLVFQYLLPTSLLFPINGDAKHPRFMPQLEARGDDEWDALIGLKWT
jgi:hypothetical protein